MPVRWTIREIEVELVASETEHPIATLLVATPADRLRLMGVPEWIGRRITLRRAHIQADHGFGPNSLGPAGMRHLALLVMEVLDVDELVLVGEIRTTGAGPGHRPRPYRFTRALPA
ncbi:hypothetical protein [Siccirubricoccus phaeus]|uniref:hypothetical protein n=1 Tax=Siccirubricoccus phaeus TaxID=2595053 RepID=UPI00165C14CB|nr:hypothetical protein [Siccirubricoccus phaeus]